MDDTVPVDLAAAEEPTVRPERPERDKPGAYSNWGVDVPALMVDVQVHADNEARRGWTSLYLTAHDYSGGRRSWSGSIRGDTAAELLAVFGPVMDELRELAKAEAAERPWFGCSGCFTPTPNVGGVCDPCLVNIEVEAGQMRNLDARCVEHPTEVTEAVAP